MSHSTSAPFSYPAEALRPTVDYLLASQRENGEIPWFDGGHTDPWNHTEAAMGLSIAGEFIAAERAYDWLASEQLDDGSWWASTLMARQPMSPGAKPITSPTLLPGYGTTI